MKIFRNTLLNEKVLVIFSNCNLWLFKFHVFHWVSCNEPMGDIPINKKKSTNLLVVIYLCIWSQYEIKNFNIAQPCHFIWGVLGRNSDNLVSQSDLQATVTSHTQIRVKLSRHPIFFSTHVCCISNAGDTDSISAPFLLKHAPDVSLKAQEILSSQETGTESVSINLSPSASRSMPAFETRWHYTSLSPSSQRATGGGELPCRLMKAQYTPLPPLPSKPQHPPP